MKFLNKLKQIFTLKKLLTVSTTILVGFIIRYCIIKYFPTADLHDIYIMYPISLSSVVCGIICGEYYDYLTNNTSSNKNNTKK